MIAMLDHSEINIKVSDVSVETIGSDEYRELLKIDGVVNGILAMMQGRVRFS